MFRSSNPTLRPEAFAKSRDFSGGERMSLQGTVTKCIILGLIAFFTASFTWNNPVSSSGLMVLGLFGGFITAMVTIFKPQWSPVSAPIYAALEGFVLGGISVMFERAYPGLVMQAVALTFGTLFSLLLVYKMGLVRATDKFRVGLMAAMGGIFLIYVVNLIMSFFGSGIPMVHQSSPLGIAFSLFVVVVAALSLVLDFDRIEQGATYGAPKFMEWYAAFGLMVTLIWLYMEILRLLSKIRDR